MSYYHYNYDEYIIVGKENIDKVYSIIQYLPLETQMQIIFGWLASEGDKSQSIYEKFDNDEPLGIYIDLVKEILTKDVSDYDYDIVLEKMDGFMKRKSRPQDILTKDVSEYGCDNRGEQICC